MPDVYGQLVEVYKNSKAIIATCRISSHGRTRPLYMLQTRNGKRTAEGGAEDLSRHGGRRAHHHTKQCYVLTPRARQLLHPTIAPNIIATDREGLPASRGAGGSCGA